MTEPKKSIFQRASEWGVPFGLYLGVAALASIFADKMPVLSLVFWLMILGVPFLVYYFQRRKFIEDDGFTEHAGLWMMGIMLFILGGMLASLIAYLVLQYIRPSFMYEQAQAVIEAYDKVPQMKDSEVLRVIKRMVDQRLMPAPIEVVFNAYWFIAFGGSLLSAITAIVARRTINKNHQ